MITMSPEQAATILALHKDYEDGRGLIDPAFRRVLAEVQPSILSPFLDSQNRHALLLDLLRNARTVLVCKAAKEPSRATEQSIASAELLLMVTT